MQQADFSGEVRLGVPHDVVGKLMPPILRRFSQEHPNVLVTLVSELTRSLRALLCDRKVDLALMTESEPGKREQLLLTDRLVWVGSKGGDAWRRRPVAVALGQEGCAFRARAIRALTKSGIEWRPICQVGSLEPVFATLEADMAVAPFLFHTVPDRVEVLPDGCLPPLPAFHINLRLPPKGVTKVASNLRATSGRDSHGVIFNFGLTPKHLGQAGNGDEKDSERTCAVTALLPQGLQDLARARMEIMVRYKLNAIFAIR